MSSSNDMINRRIKYNFRSRLNGKSKRDSFDEIDRPSGVLEELMKQEEEEERKEREIREKEEHLKRIAKENSKKRKIRQDVQIMKDRRRKKREKQFAMDILMKLDEEELNYLKEQFEQFPDTKVPRFNFVHIMKSFFQKHMLKMDTEFSTVSMTEQHKADILNQFNLSGQEDKNADDEKALVLNLCELFSEIDFHGERCIGWEDFASYLIEAATDQHLRLQDKIKEYSFGKEVNSSEIEDTIKKICYFESWDRIVTCGKTKKCKILDPENDLQTVAVLPDHEGTILNAEYIPDPYNILVTSSADLCIRFWSTQDDEYELSHHEQLDASQTAIKYYHKKDILFTASRTGQITSWKWGYAPDDSSKKKIQSPFSSKLGNPRKVSFNYPLDNGARESFYRQKTFQLHDDVVSDMILMPKEERMITCSLDSKIKIYDIEKEKVRNVLTGHKQGVFAVTWSTDYHFLVSAGFEHEALVWIANVETAPFKLRDQKKPHQHSLVNVLAVPNSPQVITADHKGMVKIWDIRTFQCMQTMYTENNLPKNDYKNFYLSSFAYMPKRKQIVTAGKKMHIYEYERTQHPTCADDQPLFVALYNPISFTFMTAAGRDIKIWDALTGCISRVYKNIVESEITALCTDDRCRKFYIGTHDGAILCFNYSNGSFVKRFLRHDAEVSGLMYTDEDTKQLVSTSWDRSIRIMTDRDASEEHIQKYKPLGFHPEDIKCSAYSKALNILVSGDIGNRVFVFDTKNGNKLQECNCKNTQAEVVCLRFLGVLPAFVAADTQGYIRLWTVKPYQYPYHMLLEWKNSSLHRSRPSTSIPDTGAPVSNTGPQLDFENQQHTVLSSAEAPKERRQVGLTVTAMDFDPSSGFLYTGDIKGYVSVWDLSDIVESAQLKHRYAGSASATDIKNNLNLISSYKMTRALYWKAHNDAVRSIQIIRDPPTILTSSYDSKVNIWSTTGEHMDSLKQENSDDSDYMNGDDDNSKPFNFPINLDKRRRNDATTVSQVIGKIKQQLRIINLWKAKSKVSLLSQAMPLPSSSQLENSQSKTVIPATQPDTTNVGPDVVELPQSPKVLPIIRPLVDTAPDEGRLKAGHKTYPSPKNIKLTKNQINKGHGLRLPSIGSPSSKPLVEDFPGSRDDSFYITQRAPSPEKR